MSRDEQDDKELAVYVAAPDSSVGEEIWAGSGIVGSPTEDTGKLRIDFEGDRQVFPEFEDRVRRAAERHAWSRDYREGYPTRACAHVDREEVIRIGTYLLGSDTLKVEDSESLERWLGAVEGEQ